MGYSVKWVEDNLGVTRKALRGFEELGLMPPNEGGKNRDYSDEDVDRIWAICVLQGMGFSRKEIFSLVNDEDFDFEKSIAEKVEQLEEEKAKVERHLGYAKTIKLTGRFPSRPKEMGTVKFKEFQEQALDGWNVNEDPQAKRYQEMADVMLNQPEDEWKDTDLGNLMCFLEDMKNKVTNWDVYLTESILPRAIVSRISLGVNDPEVQLLVKLLYENQIAAVPELGTLTLSQFVRFESSSYMSGDVARMKERDYGKEGCKFIADAIAVFGGFKDYDEIVD